MRRYLLDTALVAAYPLNRPGAVALLSPWITRREAATSIVVYGEVVEYIRGRPDYPTLREQLRELFREITPYFIPYSIMERYADIRRSLRPTGSLIGDVDTLIAATALERSLELVTVDEDFSRVPDLSVNLIPRPRLRRAAR
jgi:predicted nucleic acid-binding protein